MQDVILRVSPKVAASRRNVEREIARILKIKPEEIRDLRIIKRSIDARKRAVVVNLTVRVATGPDTEVEPIVRPVAFSPVPSDAPVMVIVGAGPGGLFAALKAVTLGIKPVVLERGRDVDSRRIDLANISRLGRINPHSNYAFGEGGAGAYSDGKLFTRSKKRGSVEEVLQLFVQHGASPDILIDAHPHIGSDRLPHVIKAMRQTIIENGGEVHFETLVDKIRFCDGKAVGVECGEKFYGGDAVLLATGHSAHDTFRRLHESGVALEPKGLAMGVRLEHPQHLIDQLQYHSREGRGKYLPAAEYSYVTQVDGRGVYSFCMCPGGVVVPAGSDDNELVVNGMSASGRSGRWANSGMVVEIRPGDFPEFEGAGDLSMLELQENLEHRFFEKSGNSINAPAQRMEDFTIYKESDTLPATSYAPGIHSADFHHLLPEFIAERLRKGFIDFGRKCPGFLTNDAILIGLESRTSSPVRVTRSRDTLESVSHPRLYPVGEGAGYAGGIVSAAIDGMRAVEAFHANLIQN